MAKEAVVENEVNEILRRMLVNRAKREEAQRQIDEDEHRLAQLRDDKGERSIEEHLLAIAPSEDFDITTITDADRREIARCILDASIIGTAWLTRDGDLGYKREDPLRVEVRDRRVI